MGYIFSPPVVGLEIYNGNPFRIEVEEVRMVWPPENIKHYTLDLAGDVIWDDGNSSPPTIATDLKGNRKIDADTPAPLVALFETAVPGFYEMDVRFTNGCTVSG